jgi:hypothetical protein
VVGLQQVVVILNAKLLGGARVDEEADVECGRSKSRQLEINHLRLHRNVLAVVLDGLEEEIWGPTLKIVGKKFIIDEQIKKLLLFKNYELK